MLTLRDVFALLVVCFLAGTARAQDQATGSGVPVRILVTVEGQFVIDPHGSVEKG
jgi:hypothetical protein